MQPSSEETHPPIGEELALGDDSVSIVVHQVVAHHRRALVRRGELRGPGGFQKRTIVKTLPSQFLSDPLKRAEVVSAISQSAQLAHPAIAQIYDATIGANTDELSIVSECVDGYTVASVVERATARNIPLPAHVVVWILQSIVSALIFARDSIEEELLPSRLAHGHLHPNNILIRADGQVKVTDFGLATSLGANAFMPRNDELSGAYDYMAPEQIGVWQIDERSDIFALGVLLYEMSLGEHPFRASSDLQVCQRVRVGLSQAPSTLFPGYPEPLERIIERCLAIDPDIRFQSIEAFSAALLAAYEGDARLANRGAMAATLSILFPEQAKSHSGKWQIPSSVTTATNPKLQNSEVNTTSAAVVERQNWVMAFLAIAIISALFWLLLYPSL